MRQSKPKVPVIRLKNPETGEVKTVERGGEMHHMLRSYGWVMASLDEAIQYASISLRAKGLLK